MSNFHWLDLSEYLAIAAAVVGAIAAATSLNWMYALVPILLSLILSAINRWRLQQNLRLHERTLERRLDRELQQQGEVLQQEIAQARSFATALVKQTMAARKTDPAAIAATDRQEIAVLEQKFDIHKQLMLSMQEHVTGVEGSLKDVVDLLEGTALNERVEYLERHLTQVSQLGVEFNDFDSPGGSLPSDAATVQRTSVDRVAEEPEPPVDIKSLLEMISEDLSSELMADNPSGELSGDLWAKPVWNLQQTIAAHSDWVRCLSFTPDGTKLVSGSFDKTIKLWQIATGTALQTLKDHQKGVFALAVSADGKLLASGSWDELIKLWDLETGTLLENLTQHQASVRSLAISPDSKTLISGSFDCTIVLWNLPDGKVATTLTDTEPIAAIALSTDGQLLASTGDNGIVKIWSLASGLAIAASSGNEHCIGSLAIDPDGQTIAAGTVNGYIVLWQLHQRDDAPPHIELVQTIKAHAGQINACLFSPDGQYLITGSVDGKAKVWYRGEDRCFRDKARSILKGDPGRSVMSVAIAPHSQLIAIGGADGTIQVWERM
jgi:WD40 repeat protein